MTWVSKDVYMYMKDIILTSILKYGCYILLLYVYLLCFFNVTDLHSDTIWKYAYSRTTSIHKGRTSR